MGAAAIGTLTPPVGDAAVPGAPNAEACAAPTRLLVLHE